jgi:hypothetical protein
LSDLIDNPSEKHLQETTRRWLPLSLGGILLAIVIGGAILILQRGERSPTIRTSLETKSAINPTADTSANQEESTAQAVYWQQTATGWQAVGTPPACPEPLFAAPVDLSRATSVLYPGQTRGGNYKPHGGFRFDTNTNNEVTVSAPLTGKIVNGSRYLVNGELQYTFDIIADCGIMYRLGHLLTLPAELMLLVEAFPPAQEGDSRTIPVDPPLEITRGDIIATAVGVEKETNVFVDWGVYDLRTKNTISKDAIWASQHPSDLEQHAVCWFDLLPKTDAARIRALPPADPTSGSTSDYCTS